MNFSPAKSYNPSENLITVVISVIFAIAIPFLFHTTNATVAIVILLLMAFLVFAILSFIDLTYFLLTLIIVGNFIELIDRYFFINSINPPIALVFIIDYLAYFGLLVIIVKNIFFRQELTSGLKNLIGIGFSLMLINYTLQVFNPNIYQYKGLIIGFINFTSKFIVFWVSLVVFRDYKSIKYFVYLWIGLVTIGALYGCLQDWIGYTPLDQKFLDMAGNPFYHAAYDRKFSIYNDPTIFGLLLSATAVLIMVLLNRPMDLLKKILLGFSLILILLAVGYSGTRTAYVMIPAGVALFFLMTINTKRTLIYLSLFVGFMAIILFGPIYGNPTINRVRTAFIIEKSDPSFELREQAKDMVQHYMRAHPIGGGLATSGVLGRQYNPGHHLNQYIIDSGLMMIAAESGWIGLMIFLIFFFLILYVAIRNFYWLKNPKLKYLNAALACVIFSLIIAMYPQKSSFSYPIGLFIYSGMAILVNSKAIDKRMEHNE